MNPRRYRYCLLAAALAVAFWRLPVASSTNGFTEGAADTIESSEPTRHATPAPPAPAAEGASAQATSGR